MPAIAFKTLGLLLKLQAWLDKITPGSSNGRTIDFKSVDAWFESSSRNKMVMQRELATQSRQALC